MKPVDKKDMPKLIVLIGLTVCSLGFGVFQLVGATSTAAPPATAKPTDEKAAPSGAPKNGAAPQSGATSDDALIAQMQRLEGVSDPLFIRDPFVAAKVTPSMPAATPPPATTPSLPNPTSASPEEARRDKARENWAVRAENLKRILGLIPPKTNKPSGGGLLDNPSERPMGPLGGYPSAPTRPLELPPPAPPTLTVTGILIAEEGEGKSIAMVRINDHARWLSVGDSVSNDFVVRSIRKTERGSELEIVDSNNKKRSFTFLVN